MKSLVIITALFASLSANAAETRIYQTDKYGNVQYHKPSYTVTQDHRVIPTDKYGNKQYHKPGFKIEGGKLLQTDKYGNVQYNKPAWVIK